MNIMLTTNDIWILVNVIIVDSIHVNFILRIISFWGVIMIIII
jgi:hypothetical protein